MADKVEVNQKLEWLKDEPQQNTTTKGVPISFDATSIKEKLIETSRQNILVPLGVLGTFTCLCLGLVELKRGNSYRQQLYMRGRVGFQTLAILSLVVGPYFRIKKK